MKLRRKQNGLARLLLRSFWFGAIASGLWACPDNTTLPPESPQVESPVELPQSEQRWPYSRFVDEVQNDTINSVTLTSDKTQATFEAPDGSGVVTVNLPVDPGLIDFLTTNEVDVDIQPL